MMLFHTLGNLSRYTFPAVESEFGGLFSLLLRVAVVVAVLLLFGARRLSRSR